MARSSRTSGKTSVSKTRKPRGAKGRNPGRSKGNVAQTTIRLRRSSGSGLGKELKEAREQQAATSEVLEAINRSGFDLDEILQTLVSAAARLCKTGPADIFLLEGDVYRFRAGQNLTEAYREHEKRAEIRAGLGTLVGRVALKKGVVHIADALEDIDYEDKGAASANNFRSMLGVPLLRNGEPVGVFALARTRVEPFSESQIRLVSTFASQAVIAIENARLFNETKEALERQTATANILRVIAGSPTDVQPVFDAIAKSAKHLLASHTAVVTRVIDDVVHLAASTAENEAPAHAAQGLLPYPLSSNRIHARVARTGQLAVNTDAPNSDLPQEIKEFARTVGWRSMLVVPMLRNGIAIGTIGITRREAGSFDDKTIELLKIFADQAVIAIENVRLFNETQEALERQTATAEVLQVINSSPGDLAPVFEAILEKAHSLCGIGHGSLQLYDGEKFRAVAVHGMAETFANRLRQGFVPGPNHPSQRLLGGARFAQVADSAEIDEPIFRAAFELAGIRTVLFIPLRKEGLLGQIAAARRDVSPFTEKEIALLENFAAQAVIAIENARLFEELRERQAELRVTFDNMGDGVVMFGADRRLVAWNRNFQEILDLPDAFLAQRPSYADYFRYLAARGEYSADLEAELSRTLADTSRELRFERTRPDGRVIEVRRNAVPDGGFVMIYADITERKRAEGAIRLARDAAEKALRELQTAQDRLVQTQKLASLGQLTAGIAHEIKNPLNFVNNFSALSAELIDELNNVLMQERLTDKGWQEVNELNGLLKSNLEKVVQHGKRADSIVKNMLLHSREGSGEHRPVDVNALFEEAVIDVLSCRSAAPATPA